MTFTPKSSCIAFSCTQRIIYHHHRISSEKNHISCFWAQILQLLKWKKNTRVSMAEAKRWEEGLVQYLVQYQTNSILLTNVIILPDFSAKANKPNTMCFRISSFHNHTLHPPNTQRCQQRYFQIVSESGENDHQRLKMFFMNFLVNFLMEARQSWLSISLLILDLKSRHRGLFKCNGVDKIFPVVNWCAVHIDRADFDFANRDQPWKVFLIAFLFWSQQDFRRLQRYKTNSTMNTFLLAE